MKTAILLIIALSFALGWVCAKIDTRYGESIEPQTIVRKNKASSLLPPRLWRANEYAI